MKHIMRIDTRPGSYVKNHRSRSITFTPAGSVSTVDAESYACVSMTRDLGFWYVGTSSQLRGPGYATMSSHNEYGHILNTTPLE
jgi:hypothetical protein